MRLIPSLVLALALAVPAVSLFGCASKPPAHWESGGARLVLGPATWQRSDELVVVRKNGEVFEDGERVMAVDSAGRVYDGDNVPVAVLLPDGVLEGRDKTILGQVGPRTAAPPDRNYAWLGLMDDGRLVRYARDGARSVDGVWSGCAGAMSRTCVLVSHVLIYREWMRRRTRPTVGVGFGIGIGIYP